MNLSKKFNQVNQFVNKKCLFDKILLIIFQVNKARRDNQDLVVSQVSPEDQVPLDQQDREEKEAR